MKETITHKHLKRQFELFDEVEDIDDLFNELQFSTLILPVYADKEFISFPFIDFEDEKWVPVFTDIYEFNKVSFTGNIEPVPYDFKFYLNLLDEVDGIIIDVEGERFPLSKEFKEFFETDYLSDYDSQSVSLNETKQILNSIDNVELDEFLKDESNFWDFENLMDLLLKSDLLTVVLSKNDLKDNMENNAISINKVGPLPIATSSSITERYVLLYSSQDEIQQKNYTLYPYYQIVNLPKIIYQALLDDLDGIILNENSQNIRIPREFLLTFLKDFKCPNIKLYDDYIFPFDY